MSAEDNLSDDPMADIVRQCQMGSREAQRELYDACHSDVFGLMVRMSGRQDAVDLTQQVFLQLFRKIEQFRGQSKFKTWLYRLSVNESLQHQRKNRRKQQVLTHDPLDDRPSPGIGNEAKDLLDAALARLDPLLRSIFLLKESRGLSYSEIAEVTEIPEGTVGSRLNRARRQLREHLVELGWEQ